VGAIQRSLLTLEDEGGNLFFGEPALEIQDWLATDRDGRGVMNLLECQKLFQHPLLYATFLLWMLTELYELLPEAGDLDKPKIAFFFDEAHLLFKDAPKALIEKVEQVVRLIRSKGVSVWFISQNPSDIPESVLGQIGNRVQHALRAYTPNDQKALRYAARSFRANPAFDTEAVLQELGVGEALVSVLDEKGVPGMVQRANILPPHSSMNAAAPGDIQRCIAQSPLQRKYDKAVDRESAYELLEEERIAQEKEAQRQAKQEERRTVRGGSYTTRSTSGRSTSSHTASSSVSRGTPSRSTSTRRTTRKTPMQKMVDSTANTVGRELGKKLVRGLLGTLRGK
jgi:hypothetical protein